MKVNIDTSLSIAPDLVQRKLSLLSETSQLEGVYESVGDTRCTRREYYNAVRDSL